MSKSKKNDTAYPQTLYVLFHKEDDSEWFECCTEDEVGAFFGENQSNALVRVAKYTHEGFAWAQRSSAITGEG